jgi:hypothetical protein
MSRRPAVSAVGLVLGLLSAYLVTAVAVSGPAAAAGTVTVTITGQGSVTGTGVNCNQTGGPDCSQAYTDTQVCDPDLKPPCHDEAPEVELVAGPDTNGYVFNGFTGCTSTSGRSCWITVDASTNVTASFRDAQAPSVPAPSPGSGLQRGTITLSTSPTDNSGVISKVEFRVRGSLVATDTMAPYAASFNTASVADGVAAIGATAFDAAGNAALASSTITIDNTAPDVNGMSGPADQTFGPGSTQSWTWSASDATSGLASVRCSLVLETSASSFGTCSGGSGSHSVSGLPEGTYAFTVRATDNGGLTTDVTRHFTIDGTPPDTTVTSGPADGAGQNTRAVTFGLSTTDAGSTIACRLYPSGTTTAPAFAPCTTAASFSAAGLADGAYVFEARATDAVGNVDATPATRRFTVDATPPAVSFAKAPKRTVKTTKKKAKVVVAFTSEAGATFRCSLDGAAYTACPATLTLKVKIGKHTLSVVAVDAAGNVSASATTAWKVKRVRKHH